MFGKFFAYMQRGNSTDEGERSEWLDDILKNFPREHWWRLFIDGYRQYSLINNDRIRDKYYQYRGYSKPACASFEYNHKEGPETGYMKLSLYTFFSLMDDIDKPLTVELIKDTHLKATSGLLSFNEADDPTKFKSGKVRDKDNKIGFNFHSTSTNQTYTDEGLKELHEQEEELGIKHYTPDDPEQPSSMFSSGHIVYAFPCEASAVEERINTITTRHEAAIAKTNNTDEKIKIIADTIQKLERLHPFVDGNCRVFCMQLLNRELLRHNMYPTILRDPNNFDGYSLEQITEEIKAGQERFKQILALSNNPNDGAILEFKSKVIPTLESDLHKRTTLLIRLNEDELKVSMGFVDEALSKLPENSKVATIFNDKKSVPKKN